MNTHSERALQGAAEMLNEIANRPALDRNVRAVLAAEAACLLERIELERSLNDEAVNTNEKQEAFQFIMTETLQAILTISHIAGLYEMRLRGSEPGGDNHKVGDLMRRVDALAGDYLRRRFGRWAPSVQLTFSHHLVQVQKEATQNAETPTPEEGHA